MNSFIELSQQSRAVVMRETGMDELDYHLAILEAGCHYLDELTKPKQGSSADLVKLYQEHLTKLGFWLFFEKLVRHLEIAVADQWTREDGLERLQDNAWRRKRWLAELKCLPWKVEATNQLELWLKQLGPNRALIIPSTKHQPQHAPEHEHAHH